MHVNPAPSSPLSNPPPSPRNLSHSPYLLVALPVTGVFVQHVWNTGLCLGLQNSKPQLLCLHHTPSTTLLLVALIELLKLLPPAVCEARSLVGAEQRPVLIGLNSLHEEIRNPESIEQVPSPLREDGQRRREEGKGRERGRRKGGRKRKGEKKEGTIDNKTQDIE